MLPPRLTVLVKEAGRVIAGKAVISELRASGVASGISHGSIDSVYGEKCEAIGPHEPAHRVQVHPRREQLVTLRRIDPVEVRVGDRRRGDAEMHLARPSL